MNYDRLFTNLGLLYSKQQSTELMQLLVEEVKWQHEYVAFGRRVTVPRLQSWSADPGIHYRYSDNLLASHGWNPTLEKIRNDVEEATGHHFNSVLATYYRHGNDHVSWHADDEPELGNKPYIASLSLGETRQFAFKEKTTNAKETIELAAGELILMKPEFQKNWLHCVPEQPDIHPGRINLTFRKVFMVREL